MKHLRALPISLALALGASGYIKRIDDPALFEQGNELRKAIASCQDAGWLCQ